MCTCGHNMAPKHIAGNSTDGFDSLQIYICHSDESIPSQWLYAKIGRYTRTVYPKTGVSGNVCVIATIFKTEVNYWVRLYILQ